MSSHADTIRNLVMHYVPDGFRDEDGVFHDGPYQMKGLAALDALLAENQRWLVWSGGRYPDDSPGDVIHAYADGSILLDDGIVTWNPLRALEWIHDHREALAGDTE